MAQKPRILVIDDEESVRETICENLADCGFEILEAVDGDHGLKLIEEKGPPALVITDIIMPRKEGLETIIQIRRNYAGVKLIAMSGGGQAKNMDFLELAKKLGADAVMPKPFDMAELEKTVRQLVG
jgi:DNA-binding response OmpR family regulator